MRCEVCGRKVSGQPSKAIIEGAKMLVCGECAKLGSIAWEAKTEPRMKKVSRRLPQPSISSRIQPSLTVDNNLELIEDFGAKIRQAREKLGLSQEDFGNRINEKVSVLRKIETGKITPNQNLTEKLQRALKIKLMVPVSEPKVPAKAMATRASARTLGDLVVLNRNKDKNKRR